MPDEPVKTFVDVGHEIVRLIEASGLPVYERELAMRLAQVALDEIEMAKRVVK